MPKDKNGRINLEDEIIIGMNNKKIDNRTTKNRPKNVGQAYKNKKKEKEKKRRKIYKIIKRVTEILILLSILIGALMFFLMSPIFNISSIEVENNQKISEQTYISLSQIQLGQNIFSIYKKQAIDSIKTNAYVEDVKIKRQLPDKILITIEERKPAYILKYGNAYAYIDYNGYILEINKEYLELPVITGYNTKIDNINLGSRLDEEDLYALDTVIKIIDSLKTNEIYDSLTSIDISNRENYKIVFEKEGKTAYIGDASDLSTKMLYIKYIINEQKEVAGEIYANENNGSSNVYFSPK